MRLSNPHMMPLLPLLQNYCTMEKEQPTGGLHFVGKKDDLVAAKRSFRTLEDRDVLIVSHEGVFYALDSYCYREYSALQCLTQKERK